MTWPMSDFNRAKPADNDLNKIKPIDYFRTIYTFQVIHRSFVNAFFLFKSEAIGGAGASSEASCFNFDKSKHFAVTGDNINFSGFDFIVTAKQINIFAAQEPNSDIFPGSPEAKMSCSCDFEVHKFIFCGSEK